MEALQEGFSIRGYVSRMRSVNVLKCWPFDETTSEETVKSLLPPIAVKKFTWWLDELEYMQLESAETVKRSQKQKKKMLERGETSLGNEDGDAEESDIDVEEVMEVVKVKSLRGKSKAPKKRSIMEIFAVAPPVERVSSEEEEEEEESIEEDGFSSSNNSYHEDINWGLKGKRNEKKKKKTMENTDIITLRKAKRVIKKIKKKKAQKGDDSMDLSVPNKENSFKFKPGAPDKVIGNPSSSYSKEFANGIRDCAVILKRKPRLQHLDAENKTMSCKAFKLIEENQHPGLPLRSILKIHTKESSRYQPTSCILQKASQVNRCSTQKATKHVTFSDKDDILRLRTKPSHFIECLELKEVCGSDTSNIHHAEGPGKDSPILGTSGSKSVHIRMEKEVKAGPVSKEQFVRCIVDPTSSTTQNNEEELFSRFLASERRTASGINRHLPDSGFRDAPCNPIYARPHGLACMPREDYFNSPNVKLVSNSANYTRRRLIKDLGSPSPLFSPVCFKDYQKTYKDTSIPEASSQSTVTNNAQSTVTNNAQSFQFQTFPYFSPKEFLYASDSPQDGNLAGNICGSRRIHDIHEDFVGLPLNSQGELITSTSSVKTDFNQTMNSRIGAVHAISLSLPSNALTKSLGHHSQSRNLDCRTSSRNQLNLFPIKDYVKENPVVVIPSRLEDITESQRERTTNLDADFLKINDDSFHDSIQKSPGNEKIQSRMRLMGKEFIVGGSGFQGFEDGHIWKDKHIVDELHFGNHSVSNVVVHGQNKPSLAKFRETLFCPSEVEVSHRSEGMYNLPQFDSQTGSIYQSVFVARKIDPFQKLVPSLSPGTSPEVYNKECFFSGPFMSGHKSQLFSLELPTQTAGHQEVFPDVGPNVIQLKNEQIPPHSQVSAIRFPFMHPDLDRHAKSSWNWRSSVNQPPFCSKGTHWGKNSQCLGLSHPYLMPGASHGTDSSVSLKPDAFCQFSPLPTSFNLQSSTAPASLAPTSLPQHTALPVCSVQKRHGKQKKSKDRVNSRIDIRVLDNGKKSRRRPLAISNVPFRSLKVPSLGFHQHFQCSIEKPCATWEGSGRNTETAFESCLATKTKTMMHGESGADKDEEITHPWTNSSYADTARTRPVKLTAGAKHILKACQQIDHSNSSSTDSSISLSETTTGFRFSESENSASVFRFSEKTPVFEL
ncbi:uncharacterized protein LOC105176840 isoform X2 [Sesamum indicum]|uniref:Uncharacterized protein LOC105176840 isoform X2 n=1 Tax=Sesamum indicum TaxID=4182 RepID=A0A6I9UAT8_SESIN|nr:uncharacterized protein LOC105176840 isoform X2 [Sesamum indicum]